MSLIRKRICDICNKEIRNEAESCSSVRTYSNPRGDLVLWLELPSPTCQGDFCKDCQKIILETLLALRLKFDSRRKNEVSK